MPFSIQIAHHPSCVLLTSLLRNLSEMASYRFEKLEIAKNFRMGITKHLLKVKIPCRLLDLTSASSFYPQQYTCTPTLMNRK